MLIVEHCFQVRVYHQDTDAQGIVHHANYFNYLERARAEALRDQGFALPELLTKHKVQFAIMQLEAEYLRPAKLDDELEVVSSCSPERRTGLCFKQDIFSVGPNRAMLFKAQIHLVCLDHNLRPRALPGFGKEMQVTC